MARVVVTGGAGFLGSHLCEALLDRGDEVLAIDNLITGSVDNIERLFGRRGFTFVDHDVSTYVWVPGDVDAVLHFASPASPADFDRIPIQILKVGGLGTHNCLGLAKAKRARFFLASTSEVYGDPQVHPQPESYWGHVNPIGPRGVYDEAKRYAEAMTMAYHRHHGLDTRIVRIFNSILADEEVLFDDGRSLCRERVGALAARLGQQVELAGYSVPAFGHDGEIGPAAAVALVGHPPAGLCYEITTRYGRSVRVTGDHSLFMEGPDGQPLARTVSCLSPGDRIAVAGRIQVPERDRASVALAEVWDARGRDPWCLGLSWEGVGSVAWERRQELLAYATTEGRGPRRSVLWPRLLRQRDKDWLSLAEVRRLGLSVPSEAVARQIAAGRTVEMPAHLEISDELLWLLGLWVAEGTLQRSDHDAFISICCEAGVLDQASKIARRDLGLHCVRSPRTEATCASLSIHGKLLLDVLAFLGFEDNTKRIPGWILGLPLTRLKWFIEGYRVGDGVHSGKKLDEGIRHEFSAVSDSLKSDLIVALARFGICPSVGRYETMFRQKTGDRRYPFWRITVPHVSPWSPLDWDLGVSQRMQARRTGDIVWAPIRSIEVVEPTEMVYDFCVPGRENFWAGGGIMAHNSYGPFMRPDDGRAVSNFLVQALAGRPITVFGDGSQTRSFTYVDDEIRGFLSLLDSGITTPVNIGNPEEFTILELAEHALEVTGSSSEIVFEALPVEDPVQRQPDITLAREELAWEPTIGLRDGLVRTAEHFRSRLAR